MNAAEKVKTWVDRINTAMGLISGVCIVLSMVAIAWEVVARYGFNSPTLWALPISSVYLLPGAIFLGAAYTVQVDGFVRIDLILLRASAKTKAVLDMLAYIGGLGLAAILIWNGWKLSYGSYVRGELIPTTLLGWPIFPSQSLIFLGSFFLALELIIKIAFSVKSFFKSGSKS